MTKFSLSQIFVFLTLVGFALLTVGCGGESSNKPNTPKNTAEKTQTLRQNFSSGEIKSVIYPWQYEPKADLSKYAMQHRLQNPPGDKVIKNRKHIAKKSPFAQQAVFIARDLYSKSGKKRFSSLMACRSNDNPDFIRLIDIYGDLDVLLKDKTNSKKFYRQNLAKACKQNPERQMAKKADSKKTNTQTNKKRQSKKVANFTTKPGKGIKRGDIKAVLIEQDSYMGAGGLMEIDYRTYILLKDKWAIRTDRPLDIFDYKSSRKAEPEHWYRWRKKGGKYQLRKAVDKKAKWETIDYNWKPAPLKKNKRLKGTYSYISASGSVWYGAAVSRGSYTFRKNGTYTSSNSTQFGSGMAVTDVSVNSFSHCDEEGGGSIVTGTAPNVSMSSKKKYKDCGDGKAGKYMIKDYTLTLYANNGKTAHLSFYNLGKGVLLIGGTYYSTKD